MSREPRELDRLGLVATLSCLLLVVGGGCRKGWVRFEAHRLVGLSVTGIDRESFELSVRCELENPNPVDATVRDVRFSARTGKHRMGVGIVPGPIDAPARRRFTLVAPLRVRYGDLPADFPARVADGRLPLAISAELRAETSVGTYSMTVSSRGKLAIAKALAVAVSGSFRGPAVRVTRMRVVGVSLRHTRIELGLALRNLFRFPVTIKRVRFRLAVNELPFSSGKIDKPIVLRPRGEVHRTLMLQATHGKVGLGFGALLGASPRFRLQGTLWIEPIGGVTRIPFDVTADASVFDTDDGGG